VVPGEFGDAVKREIAKIHAARVIWGDVKYGNVVIETGSGRPWLVDFDYAVHLPRLPSPLFRALCDEELALFRLHFEYEEVRDRIVR
jgi:hypothetical protein